MSARFPAATIAGVATPTPLQENRLSRLAAEAGLKYRLPQVTMSLFTSKPTRMQENRTYWRNTTAHTSSAAAPGRAVGYAPIAASRGAGSISVRANAHQS